MIQLPKMCESIPKMEQSFVFFSEDKICQQDCVKIEEFVVQDLQSSLCPCPVKEVLQEDKKDIIIEEIKSCFESLLLSVPTTKLCDPNGPKCRNT